MTWARSRTLLLVGGLLGALVQAGSAEAMPGSGQPGPTDCGPVVYYQFWDYPYEGLDPWTTSEKNLVGDGEWDWVHSKGHITDHTCPNVLCVFIPFIANSLQHPR